MALSESPLARAARMKGSPSAPSTAPLARRKLRGSWKRTSALSGRARWRRTSRASAVPPASIPQVL